MKNSFVEMPLRILQSEKDATDEEMKLINRHSLKELSRDDVFIYDGICSSDELDSYDTRMDPHTTLRNFAEELKEGTALLEGHNTWVNPYGRSFDSETVEKDGVVSVRGSWYIPRNTVINATNTNDTIKAIETGVIRDMSVGFGGSDMWYKCSADGKDLYDTPYFPGDIDEEGNKVFFWIMDAHLREVSTVYKGACPGAYIEKVRSAVSEGALEENAVQKLEDRYRVRILKDEERGTFFNTKKHRREIEEMEITKENITRALESGDLNRNDLVQVLEDKGVRFEQKEDVAIRNELGEAATVDAVKELKRHAEYGKKYREDLIADAVKERVAVQGEEFNAESYKRMLEKSDDVDYIKEEAESYRKLKGEKFGSGRQVGSGFDDSDNEEIIDFDKEEGGK